MLDYYGRPAIFLPAYLGEAAKLQELLSKPEHAAHINTGVRKQGDHTALFFACYGSANLETVRLLIESGADVLALDNMGRVPFHIACNAADPEIIKYFIEDVPATRDIFSSTDLRGRTPLHALCCAGSSDSEKRRDTALCESLSMLLAMYGDRQLIKAALNQPDANGLTPVMLAKFYGLEELNSIFKEYGIDTAATPIVSATHPGVVYDYFGRTKLMQAAFDHDLNIVQQELSGAERTSNPNLYNPQAGYRTPLLLACGRASQHGVAVVTAILNDVRTNPLICDLDGSTALHFAANLACSDVMELLLQQEAIKQHINIEDNFGMTALHVLANNKSKPSMRLDCLYKLIDSNIDLFAEDHQGRTAYDIALEVGNDIIAVALYQAMRCKIDADYGYGGADNDPKPAPRHLLIYSLQMVQNGFPNSTLTEVEKTYILRKIGSQIQCCPR